MRDVRRFAVGEFHVELVDEAVITRFDARHGDASRRRTHLDRPGVGEGFGPVLEDFPVREQRLDATLVRRRHHLLRQHGGDATGKQD
jgi:hypothetical protein